MGLSHPTNILQTCKFKPNISGEYEKTTSALKKQTNILGFPPQKPAHFRGHYITTTQTSCTIFSGNPSKLPYIESSSWIPCQTGCHIMTPAHFGTHLFCAHSFSLSNRCLASALSNGWWFSPNLLRVGKMGGCWKSPEYPDTKNGWKRLLEITRISRYKKWGGFRVLGINHPSNI